MKQPKRPKLIVGINPGGNHCGLVAMTPHSPKTGSPKLLAHELLERYEEESLRDWYDRIADRLNYFKLPLEPKRTLRAMEDQDSTRFTGSGPAGARISMMDAAYIVGRITGEYNPHLIAPFRHHRNSLNSYPEELVGPWERKGHGNLRYCRAAWDIARRVYLPK